MARIRFRLLLCALSSAFSVANANPDLKFDVVTFCCPCSANSHLCETQFDHLNFPASNGHYLAMGTDSHRLGLATNGNAIAVYYNTFNDGYPTNSGVQQAARIDQYASSGFTSTGPKPSWVVLNELSASLWPSDAVYRGYVRDTVHALATSYGYNVILFSPFPNPGANGTDWQAVATDAYIGIENYLSGNDLMSNGFSISWCQGQYQSSVASYGALGVNKSRLMLAEHFGQTVAGSTYGRAGVSSNDWQSAIIARAQAAENVAFAGFVSYGWAQNDMLVSDDELVAYEDTYRTNPLPAASALMPANLVLAPQSQIVPLGGTAIFTAFAAGNSPATYQWQSAGTNLPGATNYALTLNNVQLSSAGGYSVAVSNSAGGMISPTALLTVQAPPPIAFDPFVSAMTTYTPGTNLIGQTNAAGQGWTQAGPTSSTQPTIASNSLSVTGLAASTGNSVHFGGNGTSARFNLGSSTTSGTLFYSFAFMLTDITGISGTGVFWAGFNNSAGTQTNTLTSVGARVVTRSAGTGYNIGLDKSSGSSSSFVFSTAEFPTNQVVFVVCSYEFKTTTTNDDIAQMWINPDPATFGTGNTPPATLTNNAGTDISAIASFVFFDRNAAEPAGIIADELRVGTSWASVTPPAAAQTRPVLTANLFGSSIVLSWTNAATGFLLQKATTLTGSNIWSNDTDTVWPSGNLLVVTNTAVGPVLFFRLQK